MAAERRYWYLAAGEENDLGRSDYVLSIPWWPEAAKYIHEEGDERVAAPLVFTTEQKAEEKRCDYHLVEPDEYLRLKDEYGQEIVNRALDNSAPLQVFATDRGLLVDKLDDADFLCVMVDGRLRLRQDFIEELSKDA